MTSSRKVLLVRISLVLFGLLLPFILLEAGLRIEHRIRKGTPLSLNPSAKWDPILGWTGKEHRLEPISNNPILVIGDSFTEGLTVATDKMWFAEIARRHPDKGVIAYGGLGYGTLQEITVLEGYLSQGVRPAFIVLQLCSNDILNNSFELERESLLQRAPGPRPYLEGETVRLRFPRRNDWLLYPLISISRFAYRTNSRWDSTLAEQARLGKAPSVEFEIQKTGFSFQPFRDAAHTTSILLERFKSTARGTPIFLLLVDDIEPYSTVFKDIARKLALPLIVPIRAAPLSPDDRLPDGTHLNERGNEIVGRAFLELTSTR
jgi:lysophospholipase L1-like esterase